MRWLAIIFLVFLADTTIEKQEFQDVKSEIIREAQSQYRQKKSKERHETLDDMLIKLDSILNALPDTTR